MIQDTDTSEDVTQNLETLGSGTGFFRNMVGVGRGGVQIAHQLTVSPQKPSFVPQCAQGQALEALSQGRFTVQTCGMTHIRGSPV